MPPQRAAGRFRSDGVTARTPSCKGHASTTTIYTQRPKSLTTTSRLHTPLRTTNGRHLSAVSRTLVCPVASGCLPQGIIPSILTHHPFYISSSSLLYRPFIPSVSALHPFCIGPSSRMYQFCLLSELAHSPIHCLLHAYKCNNVLRDVYYTVQQPTIARSLLP